MLAHADPSDSRYLALALAVLFAACGGTQAGETDDSGEPIAEEGAEAAAAVEEGTAGTSAAETRTPRRTSPTAEAPAPRAPETARIPAGTRISLSLDRELATDRTEVGETFTATVTEPVTDGTHVLIPAGSVARGEVTAVQKPGGEEDVGLQLAFTSVQVRGQSHSLSASLARAEPTTRKEMKGEAKKIGGGAAAGAIVGGLVGGGAKAAAAGAAVGAAAGTGITLATRDRHAVLPQGSAVAIDLDAPLTVPIGS